MVILYVETWGGGKGWGDKAGEGGGRITYFKLMTNVKTCGGKKTNKQKKGGKERLKKKKGFGSYLCASPLGSRDLFLANDRLVGLVVKAFASRAEDPGFETRLRRDFFGVESYQ